MAPQEGNRQTDKRETPVRYRKFQPYDGDICIAGISGRFPESDNMAEFEYNLMNHVDMVTVDNRRWEPDHRGVSSRIGKVKSLSKFDADFFSTSQKHANYVDPQQRIMLEVVYEALIDAGEDIQALRGSRTGVYIGVLGSEAEAGWMRYLDASVVQGTSHACGPNRISYFFDFKGPSVAYDSACSSSIVVMEAAEKDLRDGTIDQAIVGASNVIVRPATSWGFKINKMTSEKGCQAFDKSGDGFVRSEGVSAVVLKKKQDCKRIYATVLGSMSNCDGFTANGFIFPNTLAQEQLMTDLYGRYNINPSEVTFIECHGTGTPAGDPAECRAIAAVMCKDRKEPLLIGSTKTNMGHAEPAAGMCSLAKVILAIQNQLIPANLYFKNPNPNIPSLFDGRLKVVDENTPLKDGLIAINSFGMGGANAHTCIRPYKNQAKQSHPASARPRLFVYSARTEEGMVHILDEAHTHAHNVEFQALCQCSANNSLGAMPFRGATILNARQEYREIQKNFSKPRQVWFIYSGMGSQWIGMGRCMMALDTFRESMEETASYLKPLGIDLLKLIMSGTEDDLKTNEIPFVTICAIQMALTDCLTAMGVVPNGMLGHSLGETVCGYADGCLTKRETILSAYYRGKVVGDDKPPAGKMAAVGLTWEEVHQQAPQGVAAACHNAYDSVTISGRAKEMDQFMGELSARGVFVKEVNSNNIAYHSQDMEPLSGKLKAVLEKEITPKPRTSRWVCTSIPEDRWNTPLAQTASAEFQANNLVSQVLFYEGLQKIPKNAIAIEVAPAGLLQSVIKKTLGPEVISVGLQKRKHDNNVEYFLAAVGKCFSHGMDLDPTKLYPPVQFPVPFGTPLVSNMIARQWDHSVDWRVPNVEDFEGAFTSSALNSFEIDATEGGADEYLNHHALDGRPMFPGVGSIVLAWRTLASQRGVDFDQLPVRLTNVKIHQAVFLRDCGTSKLDVSLMPGTGQFQVSEGETLIASGTITTPEGPVLQADQWKRKTSAMDEKEAGEFLTKAEVYKEFILRGYEYGPHFQGIERLSLDRINTDIRWDGRWISYVDNILQMIILARQGDYQFMPIEFETVNIDPTVHPRAPANGQGPGMTYGHSDAVLNILAAGGVELIGAKTIMANRRLTHAPSIMAEFSFLPFTNVAQGERSAPATTQLVVDYADALTELSRQGMLKRLKEDSEFLPNRELVENCLELTNKTLRQAVRRDSYPEALAALHSLLNRREGQGLENATLHKTIQRFIESSIRGEQAAHDLLVTMHSHRLEVFDDLLLSTLDTPDIVKHCIDTVAENAETQVTTILEVGARMSPYFRHAFPQCLEYQTFRSFRYSVAESIPLEDAEAYPKCKVIEFDPTVPEKFPSSQDGANDLVVARYVLHTHTDLDVAMRAFSKMLKPGGFLLVSEITDRFALHAPVEAFLNPNMGGQSGPEGERICGCYYTDSQWRALFQRHGFDVIIHRQDGVSTSMFLLKIRQELRTPPVVVQVDDLGCSWLNEVKAEYLKLKDAPKDARLWLVSTSEESGLMGLYAALRWEQDSEKLRFAQVLNHKKDSRVPTLTAGSHEFKDLAKRDLTYNVYRDGRWGSYRSMPIGKEEKETPKPSLNVFAGWLLPSDVSALRWIDSPIQAVEQMNGHSHDLDLCSVYFAGVSQRDVLLANGTTKRDDLPKPWFYKEGFLGIEFSGRDSSGRRVMGLCPPPSIATTVRCPKSCLWSVPDNWTLEQAATVPQAYVIAYLALGSSGQLCGGDTVFVQAGGTDVGQAAISVALSQGCEVFTLSRNSEERAILKASFPQLEDTNIGNTSDTAFLRDILVQTNGKGADLVLCWAGGEMLQACLKLVATHGSFLCMSAVTESEATREFAAMARKDVSFKQLMDLDSLLESRDRRWTRVRELLQDGIANGIVQPLGRSVYGMEKLVQAFKAAEEGDQWEKILVKIREEEPQRLCTPSPKLFPGLTRTSFSPAKSYVIVGGLGGMGLEVADWMVTRGARKIVLNSRRGVTMGYQARKIAFLRRLGAQIEVAAFGVTTEKSVKALMGLATKMAPVGGLFNLGLVLVDGLFQDMTTEAFQKVMEVKVTTTRLLDNISRECPKIRKSLEHFVLFSSMVSKDGYMGQSNYAYANSVMERFCERRRLDGLPAFAVQWGAVADAGFLGGAGNNTIVCGTWPQRMFDCTNCLDYMMSQTSAAIISSYVIPEVAQSEASGEDSKFQQVARGVAKVLGVKDVASTDPDKEFLDMGLDSLMGVEIKQLLEKDAGLVLSTKDIQILSFSSLKELVVEE